MPDMPAHNSAKSAAMRRASTAPANPASLTTLLNRMSSTHNSATGTEAPPPTRIMPTATSETCARFGGEMAGFLTCTRYGPSHRTYARGSPPHRAAPVGGSPERNAFSTSARSVSHRGMSTRTSGSQVTDWAGVW